MTRKERAAAILKLEKQIKKLQEKHHDLVEGCDHPDKMVTKIYKSDVGNWDKYQDTYWVEKHCQICGKYWHVDSREPGYR